MYRRRYSAFESSTPRVGVLPSATVSVAAAGLPQQTASKLLHNSNNGKLSVRFDPNLPDNDSDNNNNSSSSKERNYENIGGSYDSLHAKVARKARSLSNSPLYRKRRYSHLPTLLSSNGTTAGANYQLLNSANLTDFTDGQRQSQHVSRRDDNIGSSSSSSTSTNNNANKTKVKQKDSKKLAATLSAAMPAVLMRRKATMNSNKNQQQQQQEQPQQQQQQQQQPLHPPPQQQQHRNNNSNNIANGLLPGKRLSAGHSPVGGHNELAATGLQQSLVYQRRSGSHSTHNSPRHSSPAPVHQCLLLRRRSDYSIEQIEQWKRQQQQLQTGRKISVSDERARVRVGYIDLVDS